MPRNLRCLGALLGVDSEGCGIPVNAVRDLGAPVGGPDPAREGLVARVPGSVRHSNHGLRVCYRKLRAADLVVRIGGADGQEPALCIDTGVEEVSYQLGLVLRCRLFHGKPVEMGGCIHLGGLERQQPPGLCRPFVGDDCAWRVATAARDSEDVCHRVIGRQVDISRGPAGHIEAGHVA